MDRNEIAEGISSDECAPPAIHRPYQLQATVAAVHAEAARYEDTDWPQILALYELLRPTPDNPIIALNHAIATAIVWGPGAGRLEEERLVEWSSPTRVGPRAPAGDDLRGRASAASNRRRTDRQPAGKELPDHADGAAQRGRYLSSSTTTDFAGTVRFKSEPASLKALKGAGLTGSRAVERVHGVHRGRRQDFSGHVPKRPPGSS